MGKGKGCTKNKIYWFKYMGSIRKLDRIGTEILGNHDKRSNKITEIRVQTKNMKLSKKIRYNINISFL